VSTGIASRRAALTLIEAVLERDRTLDDACARDDGFAALEPRDRAFARATALTVLRRLGQLDALLQDWLTRPPKGKARRALTVLRIGLAQLLFLDTPAHAATDAVVDLAKAENLASQTGMINAVMRRATREGAAALDRRDAARLNTPDWLWDDWTGQFGEAATREIAGGHLSEPPVDLTVPRNADEWAEHLGGTRIGARTVRLTRPGDITALRGYDTGDWWVQDAAAALPAALLGDVAGKRVIDLCAAPGGKTAQLIAAGARVTAVDRSKSRLARLRENLARLDMEAEVVTADAVEWRPAAPTEGILLDAPCSATGTLRRHPEIARRRSGGDSARLTALQRRLVEAAVDMLAPGAPLVIATCSLQVDEGPGLAAFASGLPGLTPAPIRPDEISFGDIVEGCVRTHPGHLRDQGGVDGFFISRFNRA
jgi:16S rRNA (cytosine967-C5)-methyltransferase